MIDLRRPLLVVTAALVSLAMASSVGAEEWSLSRLNPLAKKSSPRPLSRHQPSLFSPSLLLTPMYKLHEGTKKLHAGTTKTLYAGGRKLRDGTISLHNNTKKFFVKTASYLSPGNFMSSKPTPSRPRMAARPTMLKKKSKSGNWLIPSWLKSEEPHSSKTMRDFLSQKRPEF